MNSERFEDVARRLRIERDLQALQTQPALPGRVWRQREANLERAQQLAGVGSWVFDAGGDRFTWSREACRILEIPEGTSPSLDVLLAAVHPDDREAVDRAWATARQRGLFESEHRIVIGGQVKRVLERAEVSFGPTGTLEQGIGIIQDVTAMRRAEDARHQGERADLEAQKNEALARLSSSLAHEFNSILGVILGYCDLALGQLQPGDPFHLDFTQIQEAGRRSADLTRDLLEFSRRPAAVQSVVSLNALISEARPGLAQLAGDQIALLFRPAADLWNVSLDPSHLDQVLTKLAVNARDAMAGPGTMVIETENLEAGDDRFDHLAARPEGDCVVLTFRDTGLGMNEDTKRRIFEPFFTTKPAGRAAGLGLFAVETLVRENGGTIGVESAPGRGATFRLFFPRTTAPAVAVPLRPLVAVRARQGNAILLVEDDAALRELLTAALERQSYEVTAVGSAEEALDCVAIERGRFALLLTDIMLPKMDGRQLAATLLAQDRGLKVVYMSGFTQDVTEPRGPGEAGTILLDKPFTLQTLARTLRDVLSRSLGS